MTPTLFLSLETSCDETSAAVFTDDLQIRSNVVASQTDLHARFAGVVPEVAARAHQIGRASCRERVCLYV